MSKKDAIFEKVNIGPFEALIRLNKKTGIFSCDYGAGDHQSNILEEVRAWAREEIRKSASLEWRPIMHICFGVEDSNVNGLRNCVDMSAYMERMHIAWDGKRWVSCPWVVMPRGVIQCFGPNASDADQKNHPMSPDELNKRRIEVAKPWHDGGGFDQNLTFPFTRKDGFRGHAHFIEYTEANWQTIIGVMAKVRELRAQLDKLLSSAQGWTVLAKVASGSLLTYPKENENKKG